MNAVPAKEIGVRGGGGFVRSKLFLLLCVAVGVSSTACRKVYQCQLDSSSAGCIGPTILNPRVEIKDQTSLKPSNTLWIRQGDELIALWDTFRLEIYKSDEACDFTNFVEATDDCELCDLCMTGSEFEQLCPHFGVGTFPFIKLQQFEGFTSDAEPTSVVMMRFLSGCSARGATPVTSIPERNSTYQILNEVSMDGTGQFKEIAQKRIFVIGDTSQTTSYQLERYASQPPVPPNMWPKIWYRWSISKDGPWEDNFSSNVRVSKVRILTGRPGTDPLTGRFRLEDTRPVRPSRVLFLRAFLQSEPASPDDILLHSDDDELRCYADRTSLDGNIEISRCRYNFGDPTPSGTPPTFQLNPNLYDDQHITWMVEFHEGEGADFDPTTPIYDEVPPGAVLAIEFTIEKVP
ncbi:MAG TPA: hypothetical protein VIB00_15490 [Pyrinomonadaceae bacterium]